ncbi:hypothetical protein [Mesoterricola sediminis]|uniref:Uncharacterized protein n=1 Tax=Mesoterricola sediminis TaxID=2927980 RepID=A0AA48H4I6_9BACT|nr:hypothetical protein [Mesoterricola sediminis]BDU77311.1 hypothetical protein METESE_22690 [Mesoterricola sediminis]
MPLPPPIWISLRARPLAGPPSDRQDHCLDPVPAGAGEGTWLARLCFGSGTENDKNIMFAEGWPGHWQVEPDGRTWLAFAPRPVPAAFLVGLLALGWRGGSVRVRAAIFERRDGREWLWGQAEARWDRRGLLDFCQAVRTRPVALGVEGGRTWWPAETA